MSDTGQHFEDSQGRSADRGPRFRTPDLAAEDNPGLRRSSSKGLKYHRRACEVSPEILMNDDRNKEEQYYVNIIAEKNSAIIVYECKISEINRFAKQIINSEYKMFKKAIEAIEAIEIENLRNSAENRFFNEIEFPTRKTFDKSTDPVKTIDSFIEQVSKVQVESFGQTSNQPLWSEIRDLYSSLREQYEIKARTVKLP